MASGSEDQCFARFKRSGDPELLAQVFDLTAAKLLRVAIHLCKDPAEAEDLVQATFVTAMEKADRFENGRPLLPWLNGILERHARNSRARARRRIQPERLRDPLVEDPEQRAQENELGEAIDTALDKLPEAHRTVLVLKLRHGMSPAQIADALGIAPGTVRVQLHRALESLRRYLPASLALSAVLALTPTRGLAAMRTELKRHAAVELASISQGLIFGGILMKKLVAALVLVAVVASAGVLIPWSNQVVDLPTVQEPVTDFGESVSLGGDLDKVAIEADPVRKNSEQTKTPHRTLAAQAAASGGQLRVRARWADDLSPAHGIGIEIRPHDGRHPQLHNQRRVTDREGLVSFMRLAEGTLGIYADRKVKKAGRDAKIAQVYAELNLVKADFERIASSRLSPAAPQMYRFKQELQQVRSLEVKLNALSSKSFEAWSELEHSQDSLVEQLLNPLQIDFSSKLPSRSPISVETIGKEPVYVEILIERGIDLSGRVVDATGQTIADAEIWLTGRGMGEGQILTHSDAEGAFVLEALERGSRVVARAAGFEPSTPYKLGSKAGQAQETELVLANRAGILRGQVIDALGQPLAGATVRIGDPDSNHAPVFERSDAEGMFQAVGLVRGNQRVLVLAPGFQPYQELVPIQPDVITERQLRLFPGWILAGRVLDPEGEGLSGITVYADADDKPTTEVTSGTDGSFRLETLPPGPVKLRIEEKKYRALDKEVHGVAGQTIEQDLHLPAWGRIAGRLLTSSGEPLADWGLRAIPVEREAKLRTDRIDKDGAFDLETEPELAYRIEVFQRRILRGTRNAAIKAEWMAYAELTLIHEKGRAKAPPGRRVIRCDWLGEISGNDTDLVIRIPNHLLPSATLRGQVLDTNAQPIEGRVNIFVDDRKRRVGLASDGSFEIGPIIPGAYRFQVMCKDQNFPPFEIGPTSLAANQNIDLGVINPPSGGILDAELLDNRAEATRTSRWRMRILDNLGRSVKTVTLHMQSSAKTRLTAGDYRAELLDEADEVTVTKSFQIRSDHTTPLRFELKD